MTVRYLYMDRNAASIGELNCIANQVEQYLFVPLLIVKDHDRDSIFNICFNLEALLLNLELHDLRQLLHRFSDFKEIIHDLELVVFKSTHIKGVFNYALQM